MALYEHRVTKSFNICQRPESCLIVLIFGVVAHYACIHPKNENKVTIYSSSPAVHLYGWIFFYKFT